MKIEKQIINNLPDHVAKEELANQLFTAIGQLLDEMREEIDNFKDYNNYQKIESSRFNDLAATFGLNFPRNLDEDTRRILIRDIIAVYRTKGTEQAIRYVFRLIGWEVDIDYIWIDRSKRLAEFIYPSDYLFGDEEVFEDGTYAVIRDESSQSLGKVRIYGETYPIGADYSSIEVIKTPYIRVLIRAEDYNLFTGDTIGEDGTIYSYTETEEFEIVQNIVDFFSDRGRPANVAIIELVTPFNIDDEVSYPLYNQGNYDDTNGSTTDTDFVYRSSHTGASGIFNGMYNFDFPINPYQMNEWFYDINLDSEDFSVAKGQYPEPDQHYVGRHITEEGVTNFIPIIKKSKMKLSIPDDANVIVYTSKENRAKLMNNGHDSLKQFRFKESISGPVEEYEYEFELETAVSFNVENNKELEPPEKLWEYDGHSSQVNSIAVDQYGFVYSGSSDQTVRKIDPDGNELWSSDVNTTIYTVAVDQDRFVFIGNFDNTIRKIDPGGNQVWSFTGHENTVYGLDTDRNGFVYSASLDNTVRKIDPDGNQVWAFTGHSDNVWDVAVDQDGFVYSGSSDQTVRKIDPDGNQVWSFTGHSGNIRTVTVDQDGFVYSGSFGTEDSILRKIDPDGNQVWSFSGDGSTSTVHNVTVDQDGFVYYGSNDRTARKIDPDGNQLWLIEFDGVNDAVRGVDISRDGAVYLCFGNFVAKFNQFSYFFECFVELTQAGDTISYDQWWDTLGDNYGSISEHADFFWPNTARIGDTPETTYDFGSITE